MCRHAPLDGAVVLVVLLLNGDEPLLVGAAHDGKGKLALDLAVVGGLVRVGGVTARKMAALDGRMSNEDASRGERACVCVCVCVCVSVSVSVCVCVTV